MCRKLKNGKVLSFYTPMLFQELEIYVGATLYFRVGQEWQTIIKLMREREREILLFVRLWHYFVSESGREKQNENDVNYKGFNYFMQIKYVAFGFKK